MKSLLILVVFAVSLTSCNKMINKSILNSAIDAKDGDEYFVITKEGKKLIGSKITVNNHYKNYGDVYLDGKHYPMKDLSNFQKQDGYYTSFPIPNHFDDWFPRIHKGKIEAYMFTSPATSSMSVSSAYLRKNLGELIDYTTKNLYNLISDNKSALAVFNSIYKTINNKTPDDSQYKNLLAVLDSYK